MGKKAKTEQKAANEREILEEVLSFCVSAGGARAKAVAELAGEIDASKERPDIRIRTAKRDALVGIEHFRIDHCVTQGKKVESKPSRWSGELEKERRSVLSMLVGPGQMDAMANVVGEFAATMAQYSFDADPDDLARSLETRLFDEGRGHARKLESYRSNLSNSGSLKTEMGFLIEVHSDFSAYFLNDGRTVRRIEKGGCLLSSHVFDLLSRVSRDVDWLLLGFYPSFGDEIVDAAIIDCRNERFAESCRRQGMMKAELLQIEKGNSKSKFKYEGASNSVSFDQIQLMLSRSRDSIDPEVLARECFSKTADALNFAKAGKPFAATSSIQALYETVSCAGKIHKGSFTAETVYGILCGMPPGEVFGRCSNFGKRNGLGN